MKKKLLFICSNMSVGGFQRSLINLLEYMDYEKYEVDLLLINREGIFLEYLNKNTNIISFDKKSDYFRSYKEAVVKLLRKRKFGLVFVRTLNLFVSLADKGYGAVFMSKLIPKIRRSYDVCIDYGGQYQNYYMIDKIDAAKKITYFHSDYSKWDKYWKADKKYYQYADWIVTVSDECVVSMKRYFPQYENKIVCIENIVTKNCMERFRNSDRYIQKLIKQNNIIVTVGRVCHDKGIDLALETALLLKESMRDDFIWVWVGPFDDGIDYKKMAEGKGLKGRMVFTGAKADPYSYMAVADVYAQPSRFEGKAVSIEEALVLNIPVVATDFSTVHDQITDGIDGLISFFSAGELERNIRNLLTDKAMNERMREYQRLRHPGNSSEIEKLYRLIEG